MKYYWKKIEVLVFLAEIKVFLTEINEAAPGTGLSAKCITDAEQKTA